MNPRKSAYRASMGPGRAAGVLILATLVSLSLAASTAHAGKDCKEPAKQVAEVVKGTVADLSPAEVQELLIGHYQRLRLIDEEGVWASPELAAIGNYLLPSDVGGRELEAFIDTMARNAHKNKYLRAFLARAADDADLSALQENAELHGPTVFPEAITYGLMLDRLTNAMVDDWRILQVCIGVFQAAAEEIDMASYIDPLEVEKLALVEGPMLAYVYFHPLGTVPGNFAQKELPDNIDWAVYVDNLLGYTANAEAGMVLSKYHPNYGGVGETRFSDDGSVILLSLPAPLLWADLYSTWNLAFMSHQETLPYQLQKLLIPSVSSYRDEPESYIYVRSLALYAHLYYRLITKAENARAGIVEEVQWNDVALTQLWGEVNRESSLDYTRRAERELRKLQRQQH